MCLKKKKKVEFLLSLNCAVNEKLEINRKHFIFIPSGDDASKTDLKSIDTTTTTTTAPTAAVKVESSSISSLTTSSNNTTLTTSTSVADVIDSCIGGTGTSSIVTNGTTTVPITCNAASSPSSNLLNNNNKNEKGLPKAMVKPNVLTHVIGDFVIQEANEPFPLTRQRYPDDAADEPPSKYRFFCCYC